MGLILKTLIISYGHTDAFKEGKTTVPGVEFEHVRVSPFNAHRLVGRGTELDIAEISIGTYFSMLACGTPYTAIPVFPYRRFLQHSSILYNMKSGIREPKDLEGRRVGLRHYYTLTTALWARGVLRKDHGVDLDSITWVVNGEEHVQEYQPSANVVTAAGRDVREMLLSGEVDAAISVTAIGNRGMDSPNIKPLFPDYDDREWHQRTGIYPIDHLVLVKGSLASAIAADLYRALKDSKDLYVKRLASEPPATPEDRAMLDIMKIVDGDPMPVGVSKNRKTLEAAIEFAVDQKILPKKFPVEAMFAPSVIDLE